MSTIIFIMTVMIIAAAFGLVSARAEIRRQESRRRGRAQWFKS